MKLPEILIVADYKTLCAYMVLPDGLPEIVDQIDYEHDGQTSVPIVGWTEGRDGYASIAERIRKILERYQPQTWGLLCPHRLGGQITERLPHKQQANLQILRPRDTRQVDSSNVVNAFDPTMDVRTTKKEHC